MEEILIEKLNRLNSQAVKRFYDIEELDWTRPVDFSINWTPESMVALKYLPSYKLLSEEQKRKYNQYYAISICEQFVWLEQHLLSEVLVDAMKKTDLPKELREGVEHFYEEEEKHSEMFWRVAQKAMPSWYPERKFKIYELTNTQNFFFNTMCKHPDTILAWIWMALFFEERTLDYSKHYQRAMKGSDEEVDFNFWQVHYYHLLDEIRHQQMDEVFLAQYYDKASSWKRKMCGVMFSNIMYNYLAPKRNATKILNMMTIEDPSMKEAANKLIIELPTLRHSSEFQKATFGRQAIGRTLELMANYNEFDSIWKHLIHENRSDHQGNNNFIKQS